MSGQNSKLKTINSMKKSAQYGSLLLLPLRKVLARLPQLARDLAQWILEDHLPVCFSNSNSTSCFGMTKLVANTLPIHL